MDGSRTSEGRGFLTAVVSEARTLRAETRAEQGASAEVGEAAGLLARILCQDLEPVPNDGEDEEGGDGEPELELSSEAAQEADDEVAEHEAPQDPVLAPGQEVRIRRGVATDRLISVHDPEMRHGRKSQQRKWDGYKGHFSVSAESEFVTEVNVTPANVGDAEAATGLLEAHRRRGLEPVAVVGDMAYSAAELRAIARAEGTEIVARVPPTPAPGGRFSKDRFTLDLEAMVATCPAGRTTSRTHRRGNGSQFVFDGADCAACELRTRCTSKAPEKMRATGLGRTVSVHPREGLLKEARQRQETERFQQLHAKRPAVERKIAHLMRRGLRQARYVGTRKTRFQALATALVANLARLGTVLGAEPGDQGRWSGPALAAA
jgi:IS5 family transposase